VFPFFTVSGPRLSGIRLLVGRLVWSLVPRAWTSIFLFCFHSPLILALLLTCLVVPLSLVGSGAPIICSARLLLGSVPSSMVLRLEKVCLISHPLILVIVWRVRCMFNSIFVALNLVAVDVAGGDCLL
jgi:hypothetical protein